MITKLLRLGEWQEILNQMDWSDLPTKEQIQKTILQELTRGKVTFIEQDPNLPIEKGCRVTLKTQSDLPKFNKEKTVVTVGSGFYNRDLEAMLCGMKVGESAQLSIQEKTVSFSILKAEKKDYPSLTNELVKEQNLEGIETLEQYQTYMEKKIKTDVISGHFEDFLTQVKSQSEMNVMVPEDIQGVIDREYDALNFRFHLDEFSDEKWAKEFGNLQLKEFYLQIYPDVGTLFGTVNKASFYESRKAHAEEAIATSVLLNAILGKDLDPTTTLHAEDELEKEMIEKIIELTNEMKKEKN